MLLYEEILYEYIEFKKPKIQTEKEKIKDTIKNLIDYLKEIGIHNFILLFASKTKSILTRWWLFLYDSHICCIKCNPCISI